jgi:oligosaccharide repeat unit polymerase
MKKLAGSLKLPNTASFFMLFYILIPVIGSMLLNTFYFEYEYNIGFYERKDLLLNIWVYTIAGLLFIPVGMYSANYLLRYHPKENFTQFIQAPLDYRSEKKLFYITLLFMGISLCALIIYIEKIGNIPLIGVLQGLSPETLAHLRSNAGAAFEGKVYRYMIFIKILPLLLLIISFMLKSKNRRWSLLFTFIFIYNIFVSLMDLQKAPIVNMLVLLLITHFYLKGRIQWKYFIGVTLLLVGLMVTMYSFFMGHSSGSLISKLSLPFHRIFIGSISPVFWWQLYVEQHGYLHGLSLPNPKHIFDFKHIQITKEIMQFVHPELKEAGITGSMPTVFWADWFINFGKYAIFLSMILLGIIIQSVDILFVRLMQKRKNILLLSLFVYILFFFKKYIATSYFGIIFDTGIIIPISFIFGLYYILQKVERKNI